MRSFLLILLASVLPAVGQAPVSLLERDALSDVVWASPRAALVERGVTFHLEYRSEVLANTSGGIRRGVVYEALADAWVDVDFGLLLGWTAPDEQGGRRSLGPTLRARLLYPHGKGLSEQYVGDLGTLSSFDFYDSVRLFELWLEQPVGTRASLRAGLMSLDEEFALSNHGGVFMHSCFGAPTGISGNFSVPIYAISALGARLEVVPFDGVFARFAAFDGNPATGVFGDPTPGARESTEFNHFNTHWALRPEEGAVFIGEMGYEFNQPGEEEAPPDGKSAPRGWAGRYFAGGLYHTDGFSDVGDVQLGDMGSSLAPEFARERDDNHAFYFVGEQEVWREDYARPHQGHADVFVRGVFTPEDRNFFHYSVDAGLHYTGLLPGRDGDEFGIAFAWFQISDDVRGAVRRANLADVVWVDEPDFEAVIEVTYKVRVAPWLSVQPDFQYVIQPGGDGRLDNALVVGVRTSVVF